jgi:putative NADH-flavin reductase
MIQKAKIAIVGGGGRTGQYVVSELLEKGFQLKLLLRNLNDFHIENPSIEIIKGDVLDPAAVSSLIEGCDAIINTVGQRKGEPLVASQATVNVLEEIKKLRQNGRQIRYILVAGLNVDTPFDKKGPETKRATEWMKTNFPSIHNDRQKAYKILSASDLDWILVRVPFIEFTGDRAEVKADLEDSLGQIISAADIAGFLIDQLSDDTYLRQAPFIANSPR